MADITPNSNGPVEGPLTEHDFNLLSSPEASEDGKSVDEPRGEKTLANLELEIVNEKWDLEGQRKTEAQANALRRKFFSEHSTTVRSKNHLDSNIFHVLARLDDKKLRKIKLLVYWVVELCGEMLSHADNQGQTGLHAAIQQRNYRMVRYVLDAHERYKDDRKWDIDDILKIRSTSQGGNNLLHLAMKWMTPVSPKDQDKLKVIEQLIKKASVETLRMQNQDGLTPLHLAVEGGKCTPQQFEIVEKLVEACEPALDVRRDKERVILSPYQYHQTTYDEWKKKEQPDKQKSGHTGSKTQDAELQYDKPDGRKTKDAEESAKGEITEIPTQTSGTSNFNPPQKPFERGTTSPYISKPSVQRLWPDSKKPIVDGAPDKPNSDISQGVESNTKLRRQSTLGKEMKRRVANGIVPEAPREQKPTPSSVETTEMQPSQTSAKTTSKQKESLARVKEPPNNKVTEKSAGEIAKYLKHTYLRKRNRQKALDFLYGGVSEKQIDFNLYGKEGEICEEDFAEGYKCANLQDTLQFVRIPQLKIKPKPLPALAGEQADEHLAGPPEFSRTKDLVVGRTDLGMIFRWLRKPAGVDKIIKLIVDDSHPPPHSDEEIERAVRPFDVEVWDWRKIDLCCETIAEAAPGARHVNLYWSGNNAVLRGWSDPEGGLARLPQLKTVVVFPQSGIEGSSRNQRNFNHFKGRLELYAKQKDIKIRLDDSESQLQTTQTRRVKNDDALQNQHWLKCMDSFAHFIVNVRLKSPRQQPIKIAIIDDGIDTTERELRDRVIGGQCFCAKDESPSFCVSAGGHGTTMARVIARVFPQVEILSPKLDEHTQSDGSSQFSVQSAADAIRWAQRQGVSIINMSWSIEKTEANKDQLDDLARALNLADESKILMFCSANDQGKTADQSYPGHFKRGTLCKIGAATATGSEYHYVSLPDVDFLFPGRVVEQEHDEDAEDNAGASAKDRSKEGSSLATAFASGLAGLILYILQLTSLYYGEDDKESDVAALYDRVRKDPGKMKEVFRKLATGDKKFVEVWKVFEDAGEVLRTGGRLAENRFGFLSKICSELLAGVN